MPLPEPVGKTIGMALLATTVVVATAAVMVLAIELVCLIFLAILFGIFLNKTSEQLSETTSWRYGLCLGLITSGFVLALAASSYIFAVKTESQLERASDNFDQSVVELERWLQKRPLLLKAVRKFPFADELILMHHANSEKGSPLVPEGTSKSNEVMEEEEQSSSNAGQDETTNSPNSSDSSDSTDSTGSDGLSSRVLQSFAVKLVDVIAKVTSTTFGTAANVLLVFFIGLFIAVHPSLYRDGVVVLFPESRRSRTREVMQQMGDNLFNWLIGRFIAMVITGTGMGLALWILGVPMALTIGGITGLLAFIPNIGAVIALVLASLMALTQGPMTVVWVVVAYVTMQLIESNVITPLIQQRQTSIPPALLLSFQMIMGVLIGFIGVTVATPLMAAGLVLVREFWVRDTLGGD